MTPPTESLDNPLTERMDNEQLLLPLPNPHSDLYYYYQENSTNTPTALSQQGQENATPFKPMYFMPYGTRQ